MPRLRKGLAEIDLCERQFRPNPQLVGESALIDPLERWREHGAKPDYAGLLSFGGLPYTEDPAELEGIDVAIVGAPTDDLVSNRPGRDSARVGSARRAAHPARTSR